ncbi:MAG: hypothetical protein R8G66_20350 [Cytophagales bacterium]|nr:hypothetical protein [Cytophagales bacterium]
MRKFLFATIMGLFALQLNAQTEQGKLLLGAGSNSGLSFQSQDGVEDNQVAFSLNAQGGYFFIDNLVTGLNLGFNTSSQGDFSNTNLSIGPFARYYFDNVFFGANFSLVNNNSDNGVSDFSANGSLLGLELGYAAFLNNNIAIEPALTYFNTNGDFDGLTGFSLNIGFSIYLAP